MITAMKLVQIIFQSVAILFMICFMFIGIWSFIVFLKMAKNQRIQTYLLEKINNSISALEKTNDIEKINDNESYLNSDCLIDDLITNDKNNIVNIDNDIE